MKILSIEDEKEISLFLKTNLEHIGFSVDIAETAEGGLFLASTNEHDLILLDLNLPDKNGIEVCKSLRLSGNKVPILILSVNEGVNDKISLLEAGADDYLTKPYSITELSARIKAITRRPQTIKSEILSYKDLYLDSNKQIIKKGENIIYLTRKEFILLSYLLRNKGRVISRGEILEHVWDKEADIFSNTIETHILNLRRKINKDDNESFIKTYSGRGYAIS
ncbi:MAG: response regulator transcription factor [Patescibacteria group bacterium]|jgi:DNA-binding response OmpR family regulator|nr:response regulator transcription factor [Patescibacteria group bacterium]